MPGSIQSSDYVPGVSGCKLNTLTGEFEINSARPYSGVEAQMIIVTAGEWSEYDLPANAIERYAFIGAEVAKIPAEYRDKAEFATKDFSFDCDGSDVRTTLTYERQETPEEIVARLEKAKVAGSHISIKNGLMTVTHDGVVRIKLGNLDWSEQLQLFKIDGDKVYLNEAFVDDGSVAKAKIGAGFQVPIPGVYVDADGRLRVKRDDASSDEGLDSKLAANWSLKMQVNANGQYVAAGIGVGLPSQLLVSADRFSIKERNASDILRDILGKIGETELGLELKDRIAQIDGSVDQKIKEVIRSELMPGGLLHRSR